MSPHHYWRENPLELDPSGGLYTLSSHDMPANACTELLDCYVLPSGGIKAFAKWEQFSTTGLPATETIYGFYARGGIPLRSGAPSESSDLYVLTMNTSTFVPRLYRWDLTDDVTPPTQWELIHTFPTGTTAGRVMPFFTPYVVSSTTDVYMSLNYVVSGTTMGIYKIRYSDGNVSQIFASQNPHNLVTHGDRMIFGMSDGNGSRIWFNEPGSTTFAAANFIDPLPFVRLTATSWMKSFVGDLLIGKQAAPFTLMQGSLTEPTVRTMLNSHFPGLIQATAETDHGVAFQAFRDGIYLTRTGGDMTRISEQHLPDLIVGDDATAGDTSIGAMTYMHPFLFHPSGLIWDARTQVWFRTSAYGISAGASNLWGKYLTTDAHPDFVRVYSVQPNVGGTAKIQFIQASEGQFTRSSTYTYKSPPLRHPSSRQLVIREVEIWCYPYNSTTSITVTVNGQARTKTNIGPSGERQKVRFLFDEYGEYLDVTVAVNSNDTAVEAPEIETIKVGILPGHHTD